MNGKFHCYMTDYPQRERLELSIIRLLILSSTTCTGLMEMAPCLPVLSRELKEQGSEWTDQFGSWFWVSDIAVGWVPISPKVISGIRDNVMDAEVGLPQK